MEHSLHLAAGHVLSHITPVDAEKTCEARDDDDDDDNETSVGATSNDHSGIISNTLCKLLGLIKQVHLITRVRYIC